NTDLQAVSVQQTGGGRSQRVFFVLPPPPRKSPARRAPSPFRAGNHPTPKSGAVFCPPFVNNGPPGPQPLARRLRMGQGVPAPRWGAPDRDAGVRTDVRAGAGAAGGGPR